MREIISLHLGQAGVNIGQSCWEQYCLEHGIQPDGAILQTTSTTDSLDQEQDLFFKQFFSETNNNHGQVLTYKPRSVFIDLEPTVIDQIQTGALRQLFDSDQFIKGKEDTSSNYARGKYTLGQNIIDICLEKIRKLTENCSNFQGFIVSNSISGGTGSGLGSLILERLSKEYQNKRTLCFNIYPQQQPINQTSILAPYNSVLSVNSLITQTDLAVTFDNSAIYDICKNNLGINKPSNSNMNEIVAQAISGITSSIRFKGFLNEDLCEFLKNLVHYERLHFLIPSFSPLLSKSQQNHLNSSFTPEQAINQLTQLTFEPTSILSMCNLQTGIITAGTLNYRGNITQNQGIKSIKEYQHQKRLTFADWSKNTYQVGITKQFPCFKEDSILANYDKTVCAITNSTAINEVFTRLNTSFDNLFKHRSFVHWYASEGMEELELIEARENIKGIQDDYQEIIKEQCSQEQGGDNEKENK